MQYIYGSMRGEHNSAASHRENIRTIFYAKLWNNLKRTPEKEELLRSLGILNKIFTFVRKNDINNGANRLLRKYKIVWLSLDLDIVTIDWYFLLCPR